MEKNDVKISLVKKNDREIVNQIVRIHIQAFKGFFLTFLGEGFLRQLYLGYSEDRNSGIFVARSVDGSILGFLAYSNDLAGFYKNLIKRRLVLFAWYSMLVVFKDPKSMKRLLRAFLKPGESVRDERYCELASIAVDPDYNSRGIGTLLINELKAEVDFSQRGYITLETDAENNDSANAFYKKNGFELFRTFETPEGRKMNEYRYSCVGDNA